MFKSLWLQKLDLLEIDMRKKENGKYDAQVQRDELGNIWFSKYVFETLIV